MQKVYIVRADLGRYTNSFEANHYVGIGWFKHPIDLHSTREEIKDLYKNTFPTHRSRTMSQNSGQIYRFINDIKIGDVVITPSSSNFLLVGIVQSDTYFESDDTSPYSIRKKVDWFTEKIDRTLLSISLQSTLKSSLTVFTLKDSKEILIKLGLISISQGL